MVFYDKREFQSVSNSIARYSFTPLLSSDNYAGAHMNPYEDRTVAFPVFIGIGHGTTNHWRCFCNAYRIQVAETPYFNPAHGNMTLKTQARRLRQGMILFQSQIMITIGEYVR
jgi:hypothetical protein